jgi:transposase InsO family protein
MLGLREVYDTPFRVYDTWLQWVRRRTERGYDESYACAQDTRKRTLDGQRVYYNHIRPHQGLDGKTPAEVAGIDEAVEGNKWEALIKKAVSASMCP